MIINYIIVIYSFLTLLTLFGIITIFLAIYNYDRKSKEKTYKNHH